LASKEEPKSYICDITRKIH